MRVNIEEKFLNMLGNYEINMENNEGFLDGTFDFSRCL